MAELDPQGGTIATAPPPAAPQGGAPGGAQADWLKTAQSGEASAPKPETQNAQPGGGEVAQQPMQTMPVAVTSMKRGGLLGVVDSIADVLAGKQRPELGKDPDGNLYVKQHDLTRGEQWMKIAGEAMHGAAAGYAAGRGHSGAAGIAGWQAGQQDADRQKQDAQDMQGQVDRDIMQKANNQMLQMKTAQFTWQQAREKVKASQEDVKFNDEQIKNLTDAGGKVIGTAAHPGDIGEILKVQPDVMAHLVQKGTIQIKKNLDENGQVTGIKAILMPDEWAKTVLPAGAQGSTFNPVSGQIEHFNYSDPVTQGEKAVHDASAVASKDEFDAKQRKAEKDAADLANVKSQTNARDQELPGKMEERKANIAKDRASTARDWAAAHKDQAEADVTAAKGKETSGPLVDEIGQGKMVAGRLAYLLARNPALMNEVAAKYPGFDSSKIDAYVAAYKDFTSGTTSKQLNSGGTVLAHLNQLRKLNTTASHFPGTPAYTAYHNQLNTLAPELAKFYGDTTIPAIEALKKTLGSTLPGNRDAAISTQKGSMEEKFNSFKQQWRNAAPSDVYEAKMPWISPEGQQASQEMDEAYNPTAQTQQQPQGGAAQPGPVQLQPGEVPHVNPQTQQQIVPRDGKWVDVKTGAPVSQ